MDELKIDTLIREVHEIKTEQRLQGEKIYDIHGKVSKLEVKSSLWGMVGGALVALLAFVRGQ